MVREFKVYTADPRLQGVVDGILNSGFRGGSAYLYDPDLDGPEQDDINNEYGSLNPVLPVRDLRALKTCPEPDD